MHKNVRLLLFRSERGREQLPYDRLHSFEEVAPEISKEGNSTSNFFQIVGFANNGYTAALQLDDCAVDTLDPEGRVVPPQ